jgi:predicted dehydrogenase
MRVMVYGCGSIGRRHIANLIALGVPAEDIRAFDLRASALAALPDGIERVEVGTLCPESSVAPPFDACLICTPAAAHAPAIRVMAAARLPFFVEKPATVGVGELTPAEWETRVPHVVGYNWRWHQSYRRAAALAQTAEEVEMRCVTDMGLWPGQNYASAIMEDSHDIDLMLRWCGPVREVFAGCAADVTTVRLVHRSGQESRLVLDPRAEGAPCRVACVITRCGDMAYGIYPMRFSSYRADLGAELDQSYVDEMAHFLDVARGWAPSQSTLREARDVTAVCEEIERQLAASV